MCRKHMECELCTISVRGVARTASLAPSSFHFSCSGQHPLQLLKGAFTSAAHSSIPFSCSPAVSSTRMLSFSEKCVLGVPGLKFPHIGCLPRPSTACTSSGSGRTWWYTASLSPILTRTKCSVCRFTFTSVAVNRMNGDTEPIHGLHTDSNNDSELSAFWMDGQCRR